MENLRIVTSCRGRFHIFDQARELARHNALHQLITDYPKFHTSRFGIPPEKVRSLLLSMIINHGLVRNRRFFSNDLQIKMDQWLHDRFSRQLVKMIPCGAQYFIGLSSFCLEALERSRELGIPCAVDHGSLHLKEHVRSVMEEAHRWGMPIQTNIAADWVIEKEDREFNLANHVFVISKVARDSMVRNGVPADKIIVNPCGVDLSQFYPAKKNDQTFRILQVGRITLGKGVLTLLDAFVKAGLKDSELWFVGGELESSGLHEKIKSLSKKGVTFFQPVPQAKLREYYNHSSVFVLSSVSDGFGMVVPQAMACGLPVIVSENVGAKDLILDGVNGFIVPTGEPKIIAERLRQLRDDPELRRSMGASAKLTVEKGFSWQDYGDRLVTFLRSQVSI